MTKTPDPLTATPVWPAATATEPARTTASICWLACASSVNAPVALMVESSMKAWIWWEIGAPPRSNPILLSAIAAPMDTPTPVWPTPTAAETAPTIAAMEEEFCASMSTSPPTLSSVLPSM